MRKLRHRNPSRPCTTGHDRHARPGHRGDIAPEEGECLPVGLTELVPLRSGRAGVPLAASQPAPHGALTDTVPGRGQAHMRRRQLARLAKLHQPRHRRRSLLPIDLLAHEALPVARRAPALHRPEQVPCAHHRAGAERDRRPPGPARSPPRRQRQPHEHKQQHCPAEQEPRPSPTGHMPSRGLVSFGPAAGTGCAKTRTTNHTPRFATGEPGPSRPGRYSKTRLKTNVGTPAHQRTNRTVDGCDRHRLRPCLHPRPEPGPAA